MISFHIKKGILTIEDKEGQIFDWKHRTFLSLSLGLREDELNNSFSSEDTKNFQMIVKETLAYFKDEGLCFETDNAIKDLILNIEKEDLEFKDAKKSFGDEANISSSSLFVRPLKPYQKKGVEHLVKIRHGANYSVPGSGKTTTVYNYFDNLRQNNIVDKILVVGPFSSFSPWEEEAKLCFEKGLSSIRLVGPRRQSYYMQSEKYELFLCHYQTVANDISDITDLCKRHRVLMVIDESHYIKRFENGVWSNALLSLAPYATRRVILSGTPMPNGFIDLWSQMTFLWPGKQLLGERGYYKTRCEDPVEREKIKTEIRPFFYRVKKSDLGLPQFKIIKTEYSLKPIQSQIYNALSVKLLSELELQTIDRQKIKNWRKAKMVRLLQAASNPALLCRFSEEFQVPPLVADGTNLVELIEKYPLFEVPAKIEAAIALVKKLLSENKKVLLWTTFIHNIKMLENGLKDFNIFSIHGAIPKDDDENEEFNREKQIKEFKITKLPSVLIANPAACAESISLQKVCHDAIYLDRSFNCGQFAQSLDRIHRIGLDSNEIVSYHILIAKDSIDETIDKRLDEKYSTMIKVLEEDIPIGDFDLDYSELEKENEVKADFDATVRDMKKFLKPSQKKI